MDCTKVSSIMSSYIDDQLSLEEKKMFEEHIANCDSCKEELDFMVNILKDVNDLKDEMELPSDFHENLMVEIDKVKSSRKHTSKITKLNEFRKYYTTVAAVFIALLIFGIIGISNLNKYTQDDYLTKEALPIEQESRAMPENIVTHDSSNNTNNSFSLTADKSTDIEPKDETRIMRSDFGRSAKESVSESDSQYTSREKVSMKSNEIERVKTKDESPKTETPNKKQSHFKLILIGILISVLILILFITITKKFIINDKS